jgi:broad specificity phosphatase PhoE
MILLVRHGETEWNAARRFQGQQDSPLTARGRAQARAMGGLVRDLIRMEGGEGWRLVSSPLGRAWATANEVARAAGLTVELDERLAEVACGALEGLLREEVVAAHGESPSGGELIFRGPGGESYDEVRARLESFLADLPPEPERRVVVVSHGAAGRVLRGLYAGLPKETVLGLEVPQDAVYRLMGGQVDRFDCEPCLSR